MKNINNITTDLTDLTIRYFKRDSNGSRYGYTINQEYGKALCVKRFKFDVINNKYISYIVPDTARILKYLKRRQYQFQCEFTFAAHEPYKYDILFMN